MLSKQSDASILKIFNEEFCDAYVDGCECYDIVMPLKNTNAFFQQNLNSIYKNIPVKRLLIGDAGCEDNSLDVVKSFPRVEIFDHKHFKTSGVCVADLILKVNTKHFFYLHADIYISNSDCVTSLLEKRGQAEWLEGFRSHLTIIESVPQNYFTDERSYSGMQLGSAAKLKEAVKGIHDGDLQRNEDIVIAELVKKNGGSFLKVKESSHIHQIMNKDNSHEPNISDIQVVRAQNSQWIANNMQVQVRGIVKHIDPKPYLIAEVHRSLVELIIIGNFSDFSKELRQLALSHPNWSKFLYAGSIWQLLAFMPFHSPRVYARFVIRWLRKVLRKI